MHTQTRLFQAEFPARPRRHDPEVVERAIDLLLPDVLRWIGDDKDLGSVRPNLVKILAHTSDVDGYALARKLDDMGWCPDAQLVEILDDFELDLGEALKEKVRDWVRSHDLRLTLREGDPVTFEANRSPLEGTISSLLPDTAEYEVQTSKKTVYVVPFEQVRLRGG